MSGNFQIIEELKIRSRALGVDLKEIGRRCGLAETTLRNWERGVAAPPPDALERWAGALGCRIALLPMDAGSRRGISVDWKQRRIAVDDVPVPPSEGLTRIPVRIAPTMPPMQCTPNTSSASS